MKDYPADYRAFISRELTHEERLIERNLRKKRRDLIENGTKNGRLSEFVTWNSMLMEMSNRQIYDNHHTAIWCWLTLAQLRNPTLFSIYALTLLHNL